MKITVDGKLINAVNRAGSEIWQLANGEVRHLKQDYSAGNHVFKTVRVIKDAVSNIKRNVEVKS